MKNKPFETQGKPSKISQEIEKIILSKGKQNEAHFDLFVLDAIKEISALFSTAVADIIGEDEEQYISGLDRQKIITRNEHRIEQLERKTRWFDE